MRIRSISSLALSAALLLGTAVPVAAEVPGAGKMPGAAAKPNPQERPLTPHEQAASDRKAAAAEAYAASLNGDDDVVPLWCVTPQSAEMATNTTVVGPTADAAGTESAVDSGGVEATDVGDADLAAVTSGCWTPQAYLPVTARDQIFGHYCGPAVGQVIANYSWAMSAWSNKYTQRQIAVWMGTDVNGGTSAFTLEAGLERATLRSPRRPANWDWIVTNLVDSDRDGTTGDQLHAYVQSNISGSAMPLAVAVKPHDPNSRYRLSSWPRPVRSPGHWVAIYGWLGRWDGTDNARMYFTDSSKDEGGATGKFWDPTRHFAILIGEHTRRIVW